MMEEVYANVPIFRFCYTGIYVGCSRNTLKAFIECLALKLGKARVFFIFRFTDPPDPIFRSEDQWSCKRSPDILA